MKNRSNISLIIIVLLIPSLIGCKKLFDIKPQEITSKLEGSYTMSELLVDGKAITLPYKQAKDAFDGSIRIQKLSASKISVDYTFNVTVNGLKNVDEISEEYFAKQGSKDIEIFEDEGFNKQVGSLINGQKLFLISGETDRITAIKD